MVGNLIKSPIQPIIPHILILLALIKVASKIHIIFTLLLRPKKLACSLLKASMFTFQDKAQRIIMPNKF